MAQLPSVTVLVTGYRYWADANAISRELDALTKERPGAVFTLGHGGCSGADLLAATAARQLGWRVVEVKADWSAHGKAAGPKRNQQMIDTYQPDVGLVFMHPQARGTVDCLKRLRAYADTKARVDIRVVNA